eukprot:jgi/Hompol1/1858/HPOL_005755-RA
MVQGAKKQSSSILAAKVSKKTESQSKPHRGKNIAPKDTALIRKKKLQQKLRANSITNLESTMAAKAGSTGKLTIMRSVADSAKEAAKAKAAKSKK